MGETRARKNWTKENTTFVGLKLNHNTDKDVLEKLAAVPSKQGYIKALIRADIGKDEPEKLKNTQIPAVSI